MRWLGLCFILAASSAWSKTWVDDSYEIFLTSNIKKAATSYRDYPIFWWDFLVMESSGGAEATLAGAEKLCAELGQSDTAGIRKLPCYFNTRNIGELAVSWLGDTAVRRDYPGDNGFRRAYLAALAKAALPLPRELLDWIRQDPLDELGSLKNKLESRKIGRLEQRGPYLYEPGSGRVLIPLQLDFPPTHSAKTRQVNSAVQQWCAKNKCAGVTLFGPHAGSMENETQIRQDIDSVSWVGSLSLALLVLFIVWTRRYRLLFLLPILGLTVCVSAAITAAVFGSIHGISLAFGPGLIGLAMDYGIHAAFLDPREKHTWRSNFMALLTSLVIMILLGFSAIPLLKQMMFFGVVGLTLAYAVFYFTMTRWPRTFAVAPFQLAPRPWPAAEWLSWFFLAGALVLLLQPLKLDLQQLNYETAKTEELRRWFYSSSGDGIPYNLPEQPGIEPWAKSRGVRYEGPSNLIPAEEEQRAHLSTWREPCRRGLFSDNLPAKKFFAPFERQICANLNIRALALPAPAYLRDYTDGKTWTAVLFPSGEEQVALVKERFPEAHSPREMISAFPKTFAFELAWMLPVSLIGALIFLYHHYRHAGLTMLACVPFLTGVGGFAWMALPLGLPVNFISLMGLLMVFGFSLDYGIFAVDYMLDPRRERQGVWSALAICAATQLAGFTPMAMGQHPVLHHLGHALLWGSVGTFIGTFWGVPAGYRLLFSTRLKKAAA